MAALFNFTGVIGNWAYEKFLRNSVELVINQTTYDNDQFKPLGPIIGVTLVAVPVFKFCNYIYGKSFCRSLRTELKFITNVAIGTIVFNVYNMAINGLIESKKQDESSNNASSSTD
ncbi:hypothetical protein [Candidatus Neptunochlamydia vexilliferae]|uniref:Uncharacterized protein n=1 Tax=Candidatus Neptunichlamydia vexilliferae TaxID=1651774 RepID=A0ABS0AYC2_9BACT|nr:hypothetical protein [Candidatus Neptunochlamydia vexilliferae]MBF5058965.1 hypothetical protein [Candidatus Neptunochlamydia vexilliferae]